MFTKRLIPCLDVDGGRVVKGVNFLNLRDAGDPVSVAARYARMGADELVFLDITASSDGRDSTYAMVTKVAEQVFIPLTVGGGIKSIGDVARMLQAGADKVGINTAAISNPDMIKQVADHYGAQCIVVAIDARQVGDNQWEVYTHGGRQATGIDAVAWAEKMAQYGAGELLLTSMDQDGTKNGFDLKLCQSVSEAVTIPVIASGGVGNLQHLAEGILIGKADAVLAASIFHFSEYTLSEAKQYMSEQGIAVRPVENPILRRMSLSQT